VEQVLAARPAVYAHNVEVPRQWTRALRDRRCSFDRSLELLAHATEHAPETPTKSSIMVGVGETDDEVLEALGELRGVGVSLVTIGQYLQPTADHHPVARFVTPEQFDRYAALGRELGFAYVASGPLVRSSFRAAEVFLAGRLGPDRGQGAVR
jgi:lipoic acid synthetase